MYCPMVAGTEYNVKQKAINVAAGAFIGLQTASPKPWVKIQGFI